MEATITTLGGIFRQRIENIVNESYEAPTIWIDNTTGKEREDYTNTHIESKLPHVSGIWTAWSNRENQSCYIVHNADEPDRLVVNGPIKQVGSHVIECGPLFDSEQDGQDYPFLDSLDKVFKYAKNLESCYNLFEYWKIDGGLNVPENLFWNCTKLKELFNIFCDTNLQKISPRLLERCPNLESVDCLFYDTEVEEIPEDLFKNNPRITNLDSAFAYTKVKKIPDKLLEPFKEGILNKSISVNEFVGQTPIQELIVNSVDASMGTKETEPIRSQYFPPYIPREIQWDMLGFSGD